MEAHHQTNHPPQVGNPQRSSMTTDPIEIVEVERSILGGVLLECQDLPPGVETITVNDFLVTTHRLIWGAMLSLNEKREPIDLITVGAVLNGVTPAPSVGWSAYLSELTDHTPTSANLAHHAQVLQRQVRRRDFVTVMGKALERAKDPTIDGDELMTEAVTELGRLADSRAFVRPAPLKDSVRAEFKAIEERGRGGFTGLPMGFASIDGITGGMAPGTQIIVAARPSMGKTAFANNVVHNVSVQGESNSLIFSLEMNSQEQAQRFIAQDGRIDLRRIRTGRLRDSDWPKLAHTAQKLHNDRVHIVDKAGLSITELRSIARQHASRRAVHLIVVDYLQLMEGVGDNREQQVASISRGLKALAMELRVPLIAISQLNRSVEMRQDKRPMLSDLRESGSIEQDADLVIMLYRDDYYHPKSDDEGLCEVAVTKQRNGPTGMHKLRWFKEYTRFAALDEEPRPMPQEPEIDYPYETGRD